jgi:hypothetical protein
MTYTVKRHEVEGARIIASSSSQKSHPDLWRAQNEAEQLARGHNRFTFDQELACWQGSDMDGRLFRYFAEPL